MTFTQVSSCEGIRIQQSCPLKELPLKNASSPELLEPSAVHGERRQHGGGGGDRDVMLAENHSLKLMLCLFWLTWGPIVSLSASSF